MRKEVDEMRYALAIALFALMMGAAAASLSISSFAVSPSTLKPGDSGAIQITITNTLSSSTTSSAGTTSTTTSTLENVQVYFPSVAGLDYSVGSPIIVGTINSGASAIITVPFKVRPDVTGGTLSAQFYVSQKDEPEQRSVVVPVQVVNPPIITISSDRQAVLSTDTINITIRNDGGEARRLALSIDPDSSFALVGTSQIYVGDLLGSRTVQLPLDSRNAEEGVGSIAFVLTYEQEGGGSANMTKNLAITVKKEKADVVFTQEAVIVTGRDNVLKLRVANTGRALEDFKFYLEDEEIKARGSKLVRLGNLATGEEKDISIGVFADTEPGVRNTDVTLKWVEDDVEKEEKTTVQVFVNSDADAAVFIDAKPAPIVVGGEHTLSILVSNIGSYKIQNVEVAIDGEELFDVLNAQKSQYIGGLESDDFSTVQFKVRVKKQVPGAYPLAVNVKYKDQSGEWVEKNSTAMINVRAAESAKGDAGILPVALVLAAAAGAGYWYFRMRKPKGALPQAVRAK